MLMLRLRHNINLYLLKISFDLKFLFPMKYVEWTESYTNLFILVKSLILIMKITNKFT